MRFDTNTQRDTPVHAELALSAVVESIGDDQFSSALAGYLHALCGADYFSAFQLGGDGLQQLAAGCAQPGKAAVDRVRSYFDQGLWRHDPAMSEARRCVDSAGSALIHIDLNDKGYSELRPRQFPQIRDRMVLCARNRTGAFGLSVLRANPHSPFTNQASEKLSRNAELLGALLSKHVEAMRGHADPANALSSLSDIDHCLNAMGDLPRREGEVCSRILYGMSSLGIALDLDISEETVKTYRKRAYQRLQIGSERELLNWYLTCWSRWRGHARHLTH